MPLGQKPCLGFFWRGIVVLGARFKVVTLSVDPAVLAALLPAKD